MDTNNKDCRVLLIDDEEPLLNALTIALEADGLICAKATSADQALSVLDTTASIELIVSDIRMPAMDGITLLQHVRERYEERSWLQVIFITAYASLENSVEALRLAAADFLYKPVRRDVLVKSVQMALDKASKIKRDTQFRVQGSDHLDRLAEEIHALKGLLNSSTISQGTQDEDGRRNRQIGKPLSKERLLSFVQSNDIKKKFFKDELFSDPVWNMLLDLMQQSLEGNEVAASSLYFSSGAPVSTAARRLNEMEKAGLVERKLDDTDKRRQIVRISPKAYHLLEGYFRAINDI
ncbi:response regulator [Ochrobactrum teleogrylli]|uniref:Response regulator n=1 Tax=Ochrobactrum teleogrylli TaxID=2479765 RepID=A0ABY2XYC5_9HYPH|nr:response regulator [[Ochrobactrum] teleogrylli]TNV09558.1 response regulator [[Ochrobactrum] teleogrylli]